MPESIYRQLLIHPRKAKLLLISKRTGRNCEQFTEDNVQLECGKKACKLLGSVKNRMEHNIEIIIMLLAQSETHQQL